MDDLKIIFYVIVAIIWMVYNNYKKISEQSKKRDTSKPFEEVIEENWPKKDPVKETQPSRSQPKRTSLSRKSEQAKVEPKAMPARREPMKKQRLASGSRSSDPFPAFREGGIIQPSKIVQFEDATIADEPENSLAEEIRNADFKRGIILAEVLQRPYN